MPSFLPGPPPLSPGSRKVHAVLLGILLLFGLLKGGYWSVTTQIWSPIDEAQHFGYIESLARGDGIPTVGEDLLSEELMYSVKSSPTSPYLVNPYQGSNRDANWSSTRHQYEGIHGPSYYAVMTPFYWVGQPWGISGSLLAVRFGTVVLALCAVPLTWALARRLFTRWPAVWVMAPALLVVWNGLNFGTVSNDAIILPLAAATGLQALRALERPDRMSGPLLTGALIGLTVLSKSTSLVLFPLIGLLIVAWWVARRPDLGVVLRFVAVTGVGVVALLVPWFAWNLWSYGSFSASAQVEALTGNVLPPGELSIGGIRDHLLGARIGLWQGQLVLDGDYRRFWETVIAVVTVAGVGAAVLRRQGREAWAIAWAGAALPLAFVSMEILVFVLFGGTGGPVGRHLYAALPFTAIAFSAALVALLHQRVAALALAVVVSIGLFLERDLVDQYVEVTYLGPALAGDDAPAMTQLWADTALPGGVVRVDPPCAVTAVGLFAFNGEYPDAITVESGGRRFEAPLERRITGSDVYRLPEPVSEELLLVLDDPVTASGEDRLDGVSVDGFDGDPVIRVFCASSNAEDVAFEEMFSIQRPDGLSLGLVRAGPDVFFALSLLAVLATGAWVVKGSRRESSPVEPTGASSRPGSCAEH